MHKVLAEQLLACFGSLAGVPERLKPFIDLVDATYQRAEQDRHALDSDRGAMADRVESASRELLEGHQHVEEALSLVEAVIESTTDGLLVVDLEGKIIRANRKFAEMWGVPEDVLAWKDDSVLTSFVLDQLEDAEEYLRKVRSLYATPEAESSDLVVFKDGRLFERYSQPLRRNANLTGRIWSFRDVTKRRQLEGQLRQSQKLEAIGLLAGGVAHDFNNLLTVIGGHAHLLEMNGSLQEEQRQDVAEIQQATHRASRLTAQLLAFGRKQILQPTLLDLNKVLAEVTPMLQRLIGEDIEVSVFAAREPALVTADRGQVEQVLMNLAVNARDAMASGGRLSFRLSHIELYDEPRTRARGGVPGPHVVLAVSDTGHGIPPEVLGRIFEPFFTTKEQGKGTGLGLATVYGILRQSNGFIEVESVSGAGTTFELFFPTSEGVVAGPAPVDKVTVPKSTGQTILLVEDEHALRTLVRRTLEREGYNVLSAQNGREALSVAFDHEGSIDIAVTDVVMPVMGGPVFVKHLRIARPEVPVLYLSGYTDDEIVRRGVLKSEVPFLKKPFTTGELTAAIRDLLSATSQKTSGGPPVRSLDGAASA